METYSFKVVWVALAFAMMAAIAATPCAAQNSPQDFLDAHNAARAEVGVDPVRWEPTVAAWAENYAKQYWGSCANGENIAVGPAGADMSASSVVGMWLAEKQHYDHGSNSCTKGQMCEHYTQVVSRKTTDIGCASSGCKNGGTFVICSYYQADNWASQLAN